jgi:hypothetical protein
MKLAIAILLSVAASAVATNSDAQKPVRPAEPVPVAPASPVNTPVVPVPSPATSPDRTPLPTPDAPAPSATPAESPTPAEEPAKPKMTEREMIDILSETQVEQAITSLRSNFLDSNKTADKELRRATLEGMILRLSPGAALAHEDDLNVAVQPGKFLAEIIDDRIGYLRPGAIDAESLTQIDAALSNFTEKSLKALILDLRDVAASSDFEKAADFARRFCEKGKLLFSVQKPSAKQERIFTSNMDPAFTGVLVVLTDDDTSGAAEVLAATLRLNANAMIVGTRTSGEAVEFQDTALGDGKILRVAVAQVVLPSSGAIYPDGVTPDIVAGLDAEEQAEIFKLSTEKGVSQFVFEPERPRMNEAALVANTNPEIDAEVFENRTAPPGLKDVVLQRAVDLVTAIRFYGDRAK